MTVFTFFPGLTFCTGLVALGSVAPLAAALPAVVALLLGCPVLALASPVAEALLTLVAIMLKPVTLAVLIVVDGLTPRVGATTWVGAPYEPMVVGDTGLVEGVALGVSAVVTGTVSTGDAVIWGVPVARSTTSNGCEPEPVLVAVVPLGR